jgi:hypothetical protein
LQTYHSQRLSSSARLVENEIWSPEEPSAAQQHALDLILEAAVSDPSELVMARDGFTTASAGAPSSNGVAVDNKSSTLRVEDRTFFVVPATSASMALLVDYLRLIINIELITTDAMAKVIEYLKVRLVPSLGRSTRTADLRVATSGSPSTLAPARSSSAPVLCARPGSRTSPQNTSVRPSSCNDRCILKTDSAHPARFQRSPRNRSRSWSPSYRTSVRRSGAI